MYLLLKTPALLVIVSLAVFIMAGALALNMAGVFYGPSLNITDSFFTATSALTVTGLTVYDTGSLPLISQVIILLLIQIGGIGIMTAFGFLLTALRKSWSFGTHVAMRDILDREFFTEVKQLVYFIAKITFIIESLGAVLYFFSFIKQMEFWQAAFFSVFHSVSAFCNAGFMLFESGFTAFASNTYINLVTASLIIAGGLGFTTILLFKTRLFQIIKKEHPQKRITLEAKIIILSSLVLIILGTGLLFFLEYSNPGLPDVKTKFLTSFFQSVSARTAGFNTADLNSYTEASRFTIMSLMFIGGAPASTSGGIKVTTALIVLLGIVSFIKNERDIYLWKRSIALATILKAFSIVIISLFAVLFCIALLMFFEDIAPGRLAFEAFSAFGTVGFSLGVVNNTGPAGRWIFMLLMFLGRVGPLSLFFIYSTQKNKAQHSKTSYIKEKITIG